MAVDLEAVKLYCRIDGDGEDDLLLILMDAAAEYLEGAGVPAPEKPDPLYDLAVKALVLDYYDHRGRTGDGVRSGGDRHPVPHPGAGQRHCAAETAGGGCTDPGGGRRWHTGSI